MFGSLHFMILELCIKCFSFSPMKLKINCLQNTMSMYDGQIILILFFSILISPKTLFVSLSVQFCVHSYIFYILNGIMMSFCFITIAYKVHFIRTASLRVSSCKMPQNMFLRRNKNMTIELLSTSHLIYM